MGVGFNPLPIYNMKTKQWDKDIKEGIKHKTALTLINEYWDKRSLEIWGETEEIYKQMVKEKCLNKPK